jgi:C4-dicarboxylate transporter DctM subunit
MFDLDITLVVIVLLLVTVFAGVHVAGALGLAAMVGLWLVFGDIDQMLFFIGSTAYEALRDYVFAVVPLFMLMGEFISRSGAADDIYNGINRTLSRIPGRLAHATVLGNAVFAFVTGTSLASATAFTRIAYPQMKRFGYHRGFALGSIAGSACLGMLIPPSLFMIVWGILTEQSIGVLFIAGVLPGFLLAGLMLLYIFMAGVLRPDWVGNKRVPQPPSADVAGPATGSAGDIPAYTGNPTLSFVGIAGVVFGVLGGIWVGWFTPTEGAGVGAVLGLVLGLAKGMTLRDVYDTILSVGYTSVPIMILLFAAQLYSRMLAFAGVGVAVQDFFIGTGLGAGAIFALMVLIWFLMGMIIDSVSIMLLTVPIFAPIAVTLGLDPVAFALMGILAIEAGILTPPFGLLVYAVKAVSPDPDTTMSEVFLGATPFWILLLIVMVMIYFVPAIATWLPRVFI